MADFISEIPDVASKLTNGNITVRAEHIAVLLPKSVEPTFARPSNLCLTCSTEPIDSYVHHTSASKEI